MLSLHDISLSIDDRPILSHLDLTLQPATIHTLLGPNGSGKSSLLLALMVHPHYPLASGTITLDGEDITGLSPEERSRRGLFLAMQHVPEIPGVGLAEYLRTIYHIHLPRIAPATRPLSPFVFRRFITPMVERLGLDPTVLNRDLTWFSWGERRKLEILQMELLAPRCILLDEIDAGLDIDAIGHLTERIRSMREAGHSFLIVSHHIDFLRSIMPDRVSLLDKGSIVKSGGMEIIDDIEKEGFLTHS